MNPQFRFPTDQIAWTHLTEGPEFDYPVDYKICVLGCKPELGRLDLIIEFAPKSYCHFHRHIASTTTLVLEGEQHVYDKTDDGETIHKVRKAGDYAISAGGDVHMECGGPDGAIVFFSFHSPSGHLFDLLDADRNVIAKTTIEELAAGQLAI
jgi:hypothetical protein